MPLKNKTILITRAAHQYAATIPLVRSYQAIPQSFPCLAMRPLPSLIADGLASLHQASDVLFTSANAVIFVQDALRGLTSPPLAALLQGKRIACVGKKTADSLQQLGIAIDLMPSAKNASQAGVLALYQEQGMPDSLFFFRAEEGSNVLIDALARMGVSTMLIPTYRTTCPNIAHEAVRMRQQLKQHRIDAVLLGSGRTVAHYVQCMDNIILANIPVIVVISPQVAEAAKHLGIRVDVIAKKPNFKQMMEALRRFYSSSSAAC